MPELPDVEAYLHALRPRVLGRVLERVRVRHPFLLRTTAPGLRAVEAREVTELRRIGKRLVVGLEGGLFLALHLMVAGRLRWRPARAPVPGRVGLAAFDFATGTLILTEAGSRRKAALHVLDGEAALRALDAGGLEVPEADEESFAEALRRERHTLKRALTDPRLFSGIGNAYGDEILHRAGLSPLALTTRLSEAEVRRLHRAALDTLSEWTARLTAEAESAFPERVTAFRGEMAVHGRYGQPCRVCGAPVQRIVYAENEMNYCAVCQTGGRLLADRAFSRLLREDWPRSLEEMAE